MANLSPRLFGIAICVCLLSPLVSAENPKPAQRISKNNPTGSPSSQLLNINNVTSWFGSDGRSSRSPQEQRGTLFPRGTAGIVYQDGIIWGGKPFLDASYQNPPWSQPLRVGGQTYNVGTQAGRILGWGSGAVPIDTSSPGVRMFRIRRDYYHMSADELRRDAAEFFEVPLTSITPQQMDEVKAQYHRDWVEWPPDWGAPYIERNGIPRYQLPPAFSSTFTVDSLISGHFDEPGLAGVNTSYPASQVMWTVLNDLNRTKTIGLYGSQPLGLEVQVTIWGYKGSGSLDQTYFKRVRLINKGGVEVSSTGDRGAFYVDSLFIAQWSDPDLGSSGDDLAAIDTALSMAYVYNGGAIDEEFFRWQMPPPAFGYDLLFGPLVPGISDSGVAGFRRRPGFRNLPITSFINFFTGSTIVQPPFLDYESTLKWWRMLRGYRPDNVGVAERYFEFPPNITPGPFPFSGDPITQTGFIDGLGTSYSASPGDRRFLMSTGPFRLAFGDTQEVVFACVGGLGADRLSSISAMRLNSKTVQAFANTLLKSGPPALAADITYPNPTQANVRVFADTRGSNPSAVKAILSEPPSSTVLELDLYDDGTHGDTLANDNIWTNAATLARRERGMNASAIVRFSPSESYQFNEILEGITTAGPLSFERVQIFSDNINNNGVVNPGENIRYGFTVVNNSLYQLANIQIAPHREPELKVWTIAALAVNARDSLRYMPSDPTSYYSFDVPRSFTDSLFTLRVNATDSKNNSWSGAFLIPVRQFSSQVQRAVLTHQGVATGEFEVLTVDQSLIRDHLYVIRGVDSINTNGDPGITLKDSTDGRILLLRHPIPDSLGHNMPVTDGFKVRRGSIDLAYGFMDWGVPGGQLRFSSADAYNNFEGFGRAIGWDDPAHFFGTASERSVRGRDLKDVLIKLASATSGTSGNPAAGGNPYGGWNENDPGQDQNYSYAYRYLRGATAPPARPEFAPYIINPTSGYAYQNYKRGIPLSAWDITSNPPVRLAVGFVENNVATGLVDGKWWPPANSTGVNNGLIRDWLFIFDRPYTGVTPVTELQRDILNVSLPVMWWLTVTRLNGTNFFAGDEFLIRVKHPPTSVDSWTFNPTIATGVDGHSVPESFSLGQNYPNPFNPSTSIRFELPRQSRVSITIYNVLGQEVKALVNELMDAGSYVRSWDGRNNRGAHASTGVYFYRLKAEGPMSFAQVKKMVLIR